MGALPGTMLARTPRLGASHVVIWTACESTHNQYELSVDFWSIHGNAYTLVVAFIALGVLGLFGVWLVWGLACLGSGLFGVWLVWGLACLGSGLFGVWLVWGLAC